jgi:hypothetical protein
VSPAPRNQGNGGGEDVTEVRPPPGLKGDDETLKVDDDELLD